MQRTLRTTIAAVTISLLVASAPARAEEITFELLYSGTPFGNDAQGIGFVTFDDAVLPLPGPGRPESAATLGLLAIELTISGATAGNGTFGPDDFETYFWNMGAGLDLSTQLVGQKDFFDWNVFSVEGSGAPNGEAPNVISPNEGGGGPDGGGAGADSLELISMRPAVDSAAAKQARKDLKGSTKAALATFKSDNKAALATLNTALKPLPAGFDPTDPGSFLDAVLIAVANAADAATAGYRARSNEVDNAGGAILVGLGRGSLPGFAVGDGGELDKFQLAMDKEMAKFNKNLGNAVSKLVKKTRKQLPDDAVLTARSFALPGDRIADPGNDPKADDFGFFPGSAPLLFMGYGSVNHRMIGVVARAEGLDDPVLNIYDGDGSLLSEDLPLPHLTDNLRGLRTDLPGGVQVPHGNVKVEATSLISGWTFAIGY